MKLIYCSVLFLRRQGCALRKIEGSPVLWNCKIQGAQHMICMKNLRFSSRPRAKVRRQGPRGSARAQPWKVLVQSSKKRQRKRNQYSITEHKATTVWKIKCSYPKMTGKTRVWPVKPAIRRDIVCWPAIICSPDLHYRDLCIIDRFSPKFNCVQAKKINMSVWFYTYITRICV